MVLKRLFDRRPKPSVGEIDKIIAELSGGDLAREWQWYDDYALIVECEGEREAFARMTHALESTREWKKVFP